MKFKMILLALTIILASPIAANENNLSKLIKDQTAQIVKINKKSDQAIIRSLKWANRKKSLIIIAGLAYILHEKGIDVKDNFDKYYAIAREYSVALGEQGIVLSKKISAMIENFKKEKNIEKNDDSTEEKNK